MWERSMIKMARSWVRLKRFAGLLNHCFCSFYGQKEPKALRRTNYGMFTAALLCCGSATVVPGNHSLFKGRIVKGFGSLCNAMALVFMTTPEGRDATVSFS